MILVFVEVGRNIKNVVAEFTKTAKGNMVLVPFGDVKLMPQTVL